MSMNETKGSNTKLLHPCPPKLYTRQLIQVSFKKKNGKKSTLSVQINKKYDNGIYF